MKVIEGGQVDSAQYGGLASKINLKKTVLHGLYFCHGLI
jgi:hypothetical protein